MEENTTKMMEEIEEVMKNYPSYRGIVIHKDMKALDLLTKS